MKINVLIISNLETSRYIKKIINDCNFIFKNHTYDIENIFNILQKEDINLIIIDDSIILEKCELFLKNKKLKNIDIPLILITSKKDYINSFAYLCDELILKNNGFTHDNFNTIASELQLVGTNLVNDYLTIKKVKNKNQFNFKEISPKENIDEKFKYDNENKYKDNKEPKNPLFIKNKIKVIVIGISTGGPNTLMQLISKLDVIVSEQISFPPILIVQHIPKGFSAGFSLFLSKKVDRFIVKEAAHNDVIKNNYIYISPGDYHMKMRRDKFDYFIELDDKDPPSKGHRPSVDILFTSASIIFKDNVLGIIMTGMGDDGTLGLREIKRSGGLTLGQDRASSVVYGMPKVAWESGSVDKQASLEDMPRLIKEIIIKSFNL